MKEDKPVITQETVDYLQAFLASGPCPEGSLGYFEVCGFLFAVVCSPYPLEAADWLPQIFAEQDVAYKDKNESETIMKALVGLYNQIHDEVQDSAVKLPAGFDGSEDVMNNFSESSALRQWSSGFLMGHAWLEEVWDDLPEDMDEELGSCVMVLSFFANKGLADAYYREFWDQDGTLEDMARLVVDDFHDAMISYADMGRSLRTVN